MGDQAPFRERESINAYDDCRREPMYRLVVFIDGSGTYPAGVSRYDSLTADQLAGAIAGWAVQRDVLAFSVERRQPGG
jgi:hypothetical protein